MLECPHAYSPPPHIIQRPHFNHTSLAKFIDEYQISKKGVIKYHRRVTKEKKEKPIAKTPSPRYAALTMPCVKKI